MLALGVEIEVGDEKEKILVLPTDEGLVTAVEFIRSYGSLKYLAPKEKEETDEAGKDEPQKDERDEADEDEAEEEEKIHPSSRQMWDAAFELEEKGQLAVAQDPEEDACYLVRFDDVIYPDPADFDTNRTYLESSLLRDRRSLYFAEWHRNVWREAVPTVLFAPEDAEEADEPQ